MRTPDCPTHFIYENTNIQNFLFPLPLDFSTAVSSHFSMPLTTLQPLQPQASSSRRAQPTSGLRGKSLAPGIISNRSWQMEPCVPSCRWYFVVLVRWKCWPTVMLRVILHIKLTFILKARNSLLFHLCLLFCLVVRLRPFSQSSLQILPLLGRETRGICLVRMQGLAARGVCWCIKMIQLIAETKENVSQYSWWNCGWVQETKVWTLRGSNGFLSGCYSTYDVSIRNWHKLTNMMLVSTSCRQCVQSPWK